MKKFIYLISPKKIEKDFFSNLKKVLSSKKVKFFQLRLKDANKEKIIKVSKKIIKITKRYNVKFIINDYYNLVNVVGADGCHLGQSDSNIRDVNKILKKKIIGITCHNSKKLAIRAKKNNASYIAFGSFYKSKLKPNAIKANPKVISWAKKNLKIPIVVIGGIDNKNYRKLINLGANYIAISSFIWNNKILKPNKAVETFR
ncbi:MAG: thiamine phosphate synthase [Candidatus Pelagibacter sp.]|nr:thiamine phosphate synthase [Candidatus Pelagibacter sp.]